jgi:hypothetical protein
MLLVGSDSSQGKAPFGDGRARETRDGTAHQIAIKPLACWLRERVSGICQGVSAVGAAVGCTGKNVTAHSRNPRTDRIFSPLRR